MEFIMAAAGSTLLNRSSTADSLAWYDMGTRMVAPGPSLGPVVLYRGAPAMVAVVRGHSLQLPGFGGQLPTHPASVSQPAPSPPSPLLCKGGLRQHNKYKLPKAPLKLAPAITPNE